VGDLTVGSRIRYLDGTTWIGGVIKSLEPVVLQFEDNSQIHTTPEVLANGLNEHLIERQ